MRTALIVLAFGLACAAPQREDKKLDEEPKKEIVPIIKQISEVNDDGSYTYGYESGDGSFKVETRDVDGNVQGKYGYIDVHGELKTVEYASGPTTGFEASADFIPQPVLPVAVPAVAPVPQQQAPVRAAAPPPSQRFATAPQNNEVFSFTFPNPQRAPIVDPAADPRPFNIELDGFSNDDDMDGFVDEIPTDFLQARPVQQTPVARPNLIANNPAFQSIGVQRPVQQQQVRFAQPQQFQPQPQFQTQPIQQQFRAPVQQQFRAPVQQQFQAQPVRQFAPQQFRAAQPAPTRFVNPGILQRQQPQRAQPTAPFQLSLGPNFEFIQTRA